MTNIKAKYRYRNLFSQSFTVNWPLRHNHIDTREGEIYLVYCSRQNSIRSLNPFSREEFECIWRYLIALFIFITKSNSFRGERVFMHAGMHVCTKRTVYELHSIVVCIQTLITVDGKVQQAFNVLPSNTILDQNKGHFRWNTKVDGNFACGSNRSPCVKRA